MVLMPGPVSDITQKGAKEIGTWNRGLRSDVRVTLIIYVAMYKEKGNM